MGVSGRQRTVKYKDAVPIDPVEWTVAHVGGDVVIVSPQPSHKALVDTVTLHGCLTRRTYEDKCGVCVCSYRSYFFLSSHVYYHFSPGLHTLTRSSSMVYTSATMNLQKK